MQGSQVIPTMQTFYRVITPVPVRWLAALFWTVWIGILLVQPERQPLIYTGIPPAPSTLEREILFTTAHIIAFIALTGLWRWALLAHLSPLKALMAAAGFALVFGAVTEWLQNFAPDRHASMIDLAANVLGVLVVIVCANHSARSHLDP